MFHHGPRSRDREGNLEIQHGRTRERAWRRHMEQFAGCKARRLRHLGGGTVRPGVESDLLGTGSPSPWSTVTRGSYGAKGLYMNSTVALNPDTGKLVWYYQHIGADPYDMDYAFEHIIAPVNVRGERHKAVI